MKIYFYIILTMFSCAVHSQESESKIIHPIKYGQMLDMPSIIMGCQDIYKFNDFSEWAICIRVSFATYGDSKGSKSIGKFAQALNAIDEDYKNGKIDFAKAKAQMIEAWNSLNKAVSQVSFDCKIKSVEDISQNYINNSASGKLSKFNLESTTLSILLDVENKFGLAKKKNNNATFPVLMENFLDKKFPLVFDHFLLDMPRNGEKDLPNYRDGEIIESFRNDPQVLSSRSLQKNIEKNNTGKYLF